VEQGGGGGKIVSIDLPKEADGKSKGFGFLSFSTLAAAELALKKTGTILNARPIAVDWALAKDDYLSRVALNTTLETKQAAKQAAKEAAAVAKEKETEGDKKTSVKVKDEADDDDDVKVKKEEGAEEEDETLDLAKDKRKNRSILDSILADAGNDSSDDEGASAAAAKKKKQVAASKAVKKEEEDEDEDAEMRDASDSDAEDEEEGEDEEEDESGSEEEEDEEDDHDDDDINLSEDDSQEEDSDEEEEEEKEAEEEEEEDPAAARARFLASKPSDTTKGCTVFIRNLAYDTREQDLLDKFRQFGTVKYAKVVWDKALDRSRGTAFVCFDDPAVAAKVVGMSVDTSTSPAALFKKNRITAALKANQQQGGGITLGGRGLNIALAVDRNSAAELQERNKTKQAQDKRNLYLANEGNIRPDSEAAKTLPPAELEKREKAFREKKKKLKNPNYCVSRTRLSVRNLPLDCDEKVLKRVFLKAARDAIKEQPRDSPLRDGTIGQPVVRQVKLLRSADRLDAKGEGRSKRYGFLEFEEHEHSLLALRRLNNNPEAFASMEAVSKEGRRARPFVEFALEDVRKLLIRTQKLNAALKRRQLREKQQAELDAAEEAKDGAAGGKKKGGKQAANKVQVKSSEQPRKKPVKPVPEAKASEGGGRGACFVCGEGGHVAKNCPQAPASADGEEGAAKPAAAVAAAAGGKVAGGKRKAAGVNEDAAAGKKQRGAAGAAVAAAPSSPAAAPASASASAASTKRNKNNKHRDVAIPKHLRSRDDDDGQEDRLDALARKHQQKVAASEAKRPTLHLGDATLKAAESRWF
jgi:nucleolar protein 4